MMDYFTIMSFYLSKHKKNEKPSHQMGKDTYITQTSKEPHRMYKELHKQNIRIPNDKPLELACPQRDSPNGQQT